MAQGATPQPASTVVLVRPDHGGGFEIFMNRRPENMETYAGIYVFPGGRIEKPDWSTAMLNLTQGLLPLEAQRILASELAPELCIGHWVAALRELYEEVGIQLFISPARAAGNSSVAQLYERLAEKRSALQRGAIDFPSLLRSEGLLCDLGRLTYFYHRVTPEHYPIRFDTRFYIARLPSDQQPLRVSEEVSESLWIGPQDALARHQAGNFAIMPPTLAVLRTLGAQQNWQTLCATYQLI